MQYAPCNFTVSHTATATGPVTGKITITDSFYPAVPYVINLTAVGQANTRPPRKSGKRGTGTVTPSRRVAAPRAPRR
jgi:hypothetical protein